MVRVRSWMMRKPEKVYPLKKAESTANLVVGFIILAVIAVVSFLMSFPFAE